MRLRTHRDSCTARVTNPPHGRYGIPEIVRGFETFSARRVNGRTGKRRALWRGGYYERIIRNETALDRIRAYIANNPAKWSGDTDNITRAAPAERGRV